MKILQKTLIVSAIAAGVLAVSVALGIGVSEVVAQPAQQIQDAVNEVDPESGGGITVGEGVERVVNILLFVVGVVSVIMLVIGGLRYVLSGGDQAAITSAKNTVLYAIVGIVVALLAYAIVNFVLTQFLG